MLSFVALLALSCARNTDEPDPNSPPETFSQLFSLDVSSFEAELVLNGGSFKTGPEGTRTFSDYLSPTSLTYFFYCNDENGESLTIEITPVVLTGDLNTNRGSFDCDVTLSITKDGVKKDFAAKATGNIQNNYHNDYVAILKEVGPFSGEVLVTWKDGEFLNRFHITKIHRYVRPSAQ